MELLPLAPALDLGPALEAYRRDGYARLGPIASPEALQPLRERAEALMLGTVPNAGFFFQEDAGSYHALPYGKGWQGPSLRYRKLEKLERDPLYRAAIENPLFGRIANAIIGPEVALCRAVLFTKPVGGGSALPWHQDGGPFWGLSRDPVLQIWTALDDAPLGAGCLEVVPGTQLAGLATPQGGVIPAEVSERAGAEQRAVPLPCKAGEALLLHNYLWHRSGVNQTQAQRRGLTVCLISTDVRCTRKRRPRQFLRLFDTPPATSAEPPPGR